MGVSADVTECTDYCAVGKAELPKRVILQSMAFD